MCEEAGGSVCGGMRFLLGHSLFGVGSPDGIGASIIACAIALLGQPVQTIGAGIMTFVHHCNA